MEDTRPSNEATDPQDETDPLKSEELIPALPALGILAGLGDCSLADLAAYGCYQQLPAGTEIIREGKLQNRFYVVVSGQLAVSSRTGGREVPLSTAHAGECLGEVSL